MKLRDTPTSSRQENIQHSNKNVANYIYIQYLFNTVNLAYRKLGINEFSVITNSF